jgi:glucose-1-phosphate cytidylyltransferase
VKVVILCGGQGTRLREETEYRPKPMVEIGGRPILWHIMKSYAYYGHSHFVLCLGYKGSVIKDYFLNYEAMNSDITLTLGQLRAVAYHDQHREQEFTVTLADTGQDTMTGGRLLRVKRYLAKDDTFLLTYGDGLANVGLRELLTYHRSHGRLATVTAVRPPARFGGLDITDDVRGPRVRRFTEKPQIGEGWINGGFFVLEPGVMDYIDGDDTCWEAQPLERLAQDGQLMAYRHDGFWQCMDTVRDRRLLEQLWNAGEAPWKVWS